MDNVTFDAAGASSRPPGAPRRIVVIGGGPASHRFTLASPLHKQVYDLETGECFTSAEYSLRTYPVRVEDGEVHVHLSEAA